jgi:predicted Zn finger-like uncharacterized protein
MYTRCPHCTTIFRVTAEQLRTAHSEISCVTCTETFSALDSLSDDITKLLVTAPPVSDTQCVDMPANDVDDDLEPPDSDANTAPFDPDFAATIHRDEAIDDDTDISVTINAEVLIEAVEGDTDEQPDDSVEDPENNSSDDLADDLVDDLPDDLADDLNEISTDNSAENQCDEIIQPQTPLSASDPAPVDEETSIESMEFDAPEKTWTTFFLDNNVANSADNGDREPITVAEPDSESPASEFSIDDDPISKVQLGHADLDTNGDDNLLDFQTANQDEWQNLLVELKAGAATLGTDTYGDEQIDAEQIETKEPVKSDNSYPADNSYYDDEASSEDDGNETPIIPAWLTDELPAEASDQRRAFQLSWSVLGTCAALALLLAGQLIHYNRDSLAAHELYGATVRQTYTLLGMQLYPNWPLDAFSVTGTEAITGRSSPDALDILANIIVSGRQPIGLPLIRVELHDLWTNPVASRVFTPAEYLRDFNTNNLLVNPGTALPVDVSVTDPGAAALGYIVDVCLPRRKTGLECQIAKDPFQ